MAASTHDEKANNAITTVILFASCPLFFLGQIIWKATTPTIKDIYNPKPTFANVVAAQVPK